MSEQPVDAPHRYDAALAAQIEERWQQYWESTGTFEAPNPAGPLADGDDVADRDKLYVLDMFPYPSGAGLHVGHPLGYIATDVVGRFHRMNGVNVLHALGYDAFGLPAEQYAVRTGQHPRVTTEANIATMRRQLRRLGLAHDARRSVATTDVEFYRWTQWIFSRIYDAWYDPAAERPDGGRGRARPMAELEAQLALGQRPVPGGRSWAELDVAEQRAILDEHRLAYLSDAPVNWCPGLGTVLANEEVTADGRSEVGNFPVVKRSLRQWLMRITAYADRLVDDLDRLDWPEPIKLMQRNWIGRSEGALVRFPTDHGDLEVFTTRPDTLFGATFMVVAPEHPLVDALTTDAWPKGTSARWTGDAPTPTEAVGAYRQAAALKTEVERQTEHRDKTGVFTGSFATNPTTGTSIPVFVADYVLMGYGTGAIMAVPGQDERDWEFAERFDLPIIRTVEPPEDFDGEAYTGDGPAINSANDEVSLNGMGVAEAKATIIAWLAGRGAGTPTTTYKLRDWLFSRQRYWGEPFPIVYPVDGPDAGLPTLVPAELLPVELPEVTEYSPRAKDPGDAASEPEPPLARAQDWVEVTLDLGDGPRPYRRETNVMPQWAGSCWYYLRFIDPKNTTRLCDPGRERYWMPVDLYVGGSEHAVLHLLYARFWHKVLYDLGHVSTPEPFMKLRHQGIILGEDSRKMSKSRGNVVNPDEVIKDYGADAMRLFEMFMGPLEEMKPWSTRGVEGVFRFLNRVWRLFMDEGGAVHPNLRVVPVPEDLEHVYHATVKKVSEDIENLRFNTAVAQLMIFVNEITRAELRPRQLLEPFALLLSPFAPHLAEELWHALGHQESLATEAWPRYDPAKLERSTVEIILQVNGRIRSKIEVEIDLPEKDLEALCLADEQVKRHLEGKQVRKAIVVRNKLVNIVAT